MVIQLAESYYGNDQIFETTVGANSAITVTVDDGVYTIHATEPEPKDTLQIRPKSVELVQMLEAGGLDYAWEYRSVAVQNYGVTVPKNSKNPDVGLEFIKMLVSETGQGIMKGQGQPPIVPADGFGSVPAGIKDLVKIQA